jgi:hypothetical protein
MKRVLLVVLAVVAAAAVGIGIAVSWRSSYRPPPPLTPLEVAQSVPCVARPYPVGQRKLKQLDAVAAVDCEYTSRVYPGLGQWEVVTRRVAVRGVAAAQRYFEQPDERRGGICTMQLEIFRRWGPAFVDASGHVIIPRQPLDHCGRPIAWPNGRPAPTDWPVVKVHRLQLQISASALAAHCGLNWDSRLPLHMSNPGSTRTFPVAAHTVRVCVYSTDPAHRIMRFVRGFTLDLAQAARLHAALTGPRPATGCPHTPDIAVVFPTDGLDGETVELGGCRVAENLDPRWVRTADPTVVRSLLLSG